MALGAIGARIERYLDTYPDDPTVEDRVWIEVDGWARVAAIADEDTERANAEKTSAVHFLRFELTRDMAAAMKRGAALSVGVDHPGYTVAVAPVGTDTRAALAADLA